MTAVKMGSNDQLLKTLVSNSSAISNGTLIAEWNPNRDSKDNHGYLLSERSATYDPITHLEA